MNTGRVFRSGLKIMSRPHKIIKVKGGEDIGR